jgi:branched-chain amino acid transport system permease protein
VGAIVLFLIQDWLPDYGAWYVVCLGAAAILFALFLLPGLWGAAEERFGVRLMPVGYRLRGLGERQDLALRLRRAILCAA